MLLNTGYSVRHFRNNSHQEGEIQHKAWNRLHLQLQTSPKLLQQKWSGQSCSHREARKRQIHGELWVCPGTCLGWFASCQWRHVSRIRGQWIRILFLMYHAYVTLGVLKKQNKWQHLLGWFDLSSSLVVEILICILQFDVLSTSDLKFCRNVLHARLDHFLSLTWQN